VSRAGATIIGAMLWGVERRYVSRHNFTPFGWYRIIFGLLVLAVFAS
jgi:undecaprenyl pyrophosphate phosphatase UppP